MVIDCHIHLVLEKNNLKCCDQEVEKLLDCMHRNGIDKACLIPMVFSNGDGGYFLDKESILFAARYLTDLIKNHRDSFFSLLRVNANLDFRFLTEVTNQYILEGAINGIKFCTEVNAADHKMDIFADFLESNDVPVLFHSWYNTKGQTYCESLPSDIAALTRKHPAVMAHLSGCRFRGVQDIKKYPNVSIDTSGSASEDGYLAYALKELGPGRILYGLDYPGRDLTVQLARIDSVALPQEERNSLLYENMVKEGKKFSWL